MRTLTGIGLILVALTGCASSTSDDTEPTEEVSKYTQTWSKAYSATTCAEWASQMTSQQQFAAAADMLTGARNRGDGGEGVPPDALIDEFQGGVTTACVVDTQTLAETGAALYLTERARFAP